jgi:hypothetical protein
MSQNLVKLRVWWIPQVPMEPFYVPVNSLEEANLLLDALAAYDQFQLEKHIKPDYSNVGGLQVWDENSDGDGTPGWVDWCDEETGDDFNDWRDEHLPDRSKEMFDMKRAEEEKNQ